MSSTNLLPCINSSLLVAQEREIRLTMKGATVTLFILGFALLCIHGDTHRFIFKEEKEGNKGAAGSDIATGVMTNDQNGNAIATRNTPPLAIDEMNTTDDENNDSDDENESYGSYGNPRGPSTECHHDKRLHERCQAGKKCACGIN